MPRLRHCLTATTVVAVVATAVAGAVHAIAAKRLIEATPEPVAKACPWVNSSAPTAHKARDVLAALRDDEKYDLLHGLATFGMGWGPQLAGNTKGVPRLCIPPLVAVDGPAGVGNGVTGVTQFPSPISLASTWSRELAEQYGEAIGAEALGKGASLLLAPGIDVARDPRWGRHSETLGEDPWLAAQLGAAHIQGIHRHPLMSTAKHLSVYTQETHRNTASGNAVIDERTVHEVYLPAFEAAVEAGVSAVMCSYNQRNGTQACNDAYALTQVLRGLWGFAGFTISDWLAMHRSAASAMAGMDVQMPDGCYFGPRLQAAVESGTVPQARVDEMVGRVLTSMFERGIIDRPRVVREDARVTTGAHAALARRIAAESMVVLQNDGVLPLAPSKQPLAVIGAAAGEKVIGSPRGSVHVVAERIITPLQGLTARAHQVGTPVEFSRGDNLFEVADISKRASAVVIVMEKMNTESADHGDLQLGLHQRNIIKVALKHNKRVVLVLNTGGPVEVPERERLAAVVAAWYPGQECGAALAAVLWGDINPAGRTPVSWPQRLADVPAASSERFPGGEHSEGLDVGYRWYQRQGIAPAYPFGHGLSYTTFTLRDAEAGVEASDGTVPVTVTVTNTGERAGTTVVQAYSERDGEDASPRGLRDFARVTLQPGESRPVALQVTARGMSEWSVNEHRWVRHAGTHRVWVGQSAQNVLPPLTVEVHHTLPTSGAVPPPRPGAPEGNGPPSATVADNAACPDSASMAWFVGLSSYFGMPGNQPQAVTPPTNAKD